MADFKYTISIAKAETREDGLYLTGVASGLGLDSQGHEMDPEGIERFAAQIAARAESGDPVPFVDWHKDGITAELGYVTKAEVDGDWNLHVEVKLDEENPSAVYMHSKAMKGKKYGMSVAGKATDYVRRFDENLKRVVIRFKDIALREISATTKPIWTPSFGTVLAKSVIDDADAESVTPEGDSPEMSKDDTAELNEEAADAAPADETVNDEENEDEAETVDEDVDVEKAGARYSKATKAAFLAKYKELGDLLRSEGILEDEDEADVEKSEDADADSDDDNNTDDATDNESDSAETPDNPEADASEDSAAAEPEKSPREVELERLLAEMTERAETAEARIPKPPRQVVKEETEPSKAEKELERINALPANQRLAEAFRFAAEQQA